MVDILKPYLDLIMKERFWSWSLVGIAYLIGAMMLRGWFLNPMIRCAKDLDSKYYHKFKRAYLKRSLLGWFLFFIPLVIIIGIWNQNANWSLKGHQNLALAVAGACYVLSVLCHLQAFGIAGIKTLKKIVNELGMTEDDSKS